MSLAGIRSNRGDAFQRSIALYHSIQMLVDENIIGVHVEALVLAGEDSIVLGDDIVILYKDGIKHFIQAKINHSKHELWKLTDPTLQKELISARDQLLSDKSCEFHFYSRTPFGAFQRLVEEINLYQDYNAFLKASPKQQKETLGKLTGLWDVKEPFAFELVKRIKIASHHSHDEWNNLSLSILQSCISQAATAFEILYSYIDKQHHKLGTPVFLINKKDLISLLQEHGAYRCKNFDEDIVAEMFKAFSSQGRQWIRTIGGLKIKRSEVENLKELIHKKTSTVLLKDTAGGGKTCVLLDLIDYLETQSHIVSLYIRGDLYSSVESLSDLEKLGLPHDLYAQSAFLAEKYQIVIIIDSLDVLALGRSHKTLQFFLGMICNLAHIPNITIVAASRSFDVQYDPMLRETAWDETVSIESLSFDQDIAPILEGLNINADKLGTNIKKLITIPQNLRLFYALAQKGLELSALTEHDLYDYYIREIVLNDINLGKDVVAELEKVAMKLLSQRSYTFSKDILHISNQAVQRLLSQEVLNEVDSYNLMFSHQNIADSLRIRTVLQNESSLSSFIKSQPQLPFIRPAIRSFLIALRTKHIDLFVRQFRHVLLDADISIHIKRLGIETLAEMSARVSDMPIISTMLNNTPVLFNRFLDKAIRQDWFEILNEYWQKNKYNYDDENLGSILRYYSRFIDTNGESVIGVYNQAFDEEWLSERTLAWHITSELKKLSDWSSSGVEKLLERLADAKKSERDDVGQAICKYIEATGEGDDLLWKFIVRDAKPISEIHRGKELKLNCDSHSLNQDFFKCRLQTSDQLFRSAIDYLLRFVEYELTNESHFYYFGLIECTSYRRFHTATDMLEHNSIHEFMDAVESAIIFRAQKNDPCWKEYEKKLSVSHDEGLRYLLILAYKSNVKRHVEGIEKQLLDKNLLSNSRLEYELGKLISESYGYIDSNVCEAHQNLVIDIYEEKEEEAEWREKYIYNHLSWIPNVYRIPRFDTIYKKYIKKHGNYRPTPSIGLSSGWIQSPVSVTQLTDFTSVTLIKIFKHYDGYERWNENNHHPRGTVGGQSELEPALSIASSLTPLKFIELIPGIVEQQLSISYIFSILDGVSTHLKCRFGNLNSSDWKPVEPLPDGKELALKLLKLIDTFCHEDKRGYTTSRSVEACCTVLHDDKYLDRICFLLWKLGLYDAPESDKDDDVNNLLHEGTNSPRGIAAVTLLDVCNERLEKGKELNKDLKELLIRYAKDSSIVVRTAFLYKFPYFHQQQDEFGWCLIDILTQTHKTRLFKHLERTLYYKYHSNFNQVKLYLDLIKDVDDEKAAEAWGRLATLSYLSNHMQEDEFWEYNSNQNEAVLGAIGQVFIANIDSNENNLTCVKGLEKLMKNGAAKSVFTKFDFHLEHKNIFRYIPYNLIDLYVRNAPIDSVREIYGLFIWLENNVINSPGTTLKLLENLVERLSESSEQFYFHTEDKLITTLKLLLQEADLSDDLEFINQVLKVHDWFLDHGVSKLDKLLDST